MPSPEFYNALRLVFLRIAELNRDVQEMMLHPDCHNCLICKEEKE